MCCASANVRRLSMAGIEFNRDINSSRPRRASIATIENANGSNDGGGGGDGTAGAAAVVRVACVAHAPGRPCLFGRFGDEFPLERGDGKRLDAPMERRRHRCSQLPLLLCMRFRHWMSL